VAYPYATWRAALQPASFGGVEFHVEVSGKSGGRRIAGHEYPKADTPFAEDMGRKAAGWQVTAYLIGDDYTADRDALLAVCDSEGPFTLVHPTFGAMQVHCGPYTASESRERGGYAQVEMAFFEAGQNPDASGTSDTQAQATSAASASNDATAATVNSNLGQGGIGSDAVASAQANANYTPVTTPMASPTDSFGGPSAPLTYPGSIGGIGSA
jgi:prophage DNA circulation protein